MNLRVTVKAPSVYQRTDVYMVKKGAGKSYTEIKSSFLKQRSIVNKGKMKIVDYDENALKSESYANLNPLDSGMWEEPKFYSGEVYTIQGSAGTLYYNKKKNRIEKIETVKGRANTLTTFAYDANNKMKKMEVSVIVNGHESVVTTEFLRMQKSDKVPEALFEF